ncbi:heme peroxidase [Chaetomium fimeti]|uniref:Peroxidase n=1 Tax=Chaetomium fimeti TaxID=1854472 RepID=A0AAE0HCG4_9PEZI|nr:heme peroxidase [Chaetomium fimeti]
MSYLKLFSVLTLLAPLLWPTSAYTWPNTDTDILEAIYYQQIGYDGRRFSAFVRTCETGNNLGPGRTNSAEWIRTAYHDMATADVETGIGGMDASIGFERSRQENVGFHAFTETLLFFGDFMSARSSMADLIALGAVMSVTACTISPNRKPLFLPFRAGRVDATEAGPFGTPEPHQDLTSHTRSFEKQGFNSTEMIGLVACGHSLGGVNGRDFPEIVPAKNDSTNVDSKQAFDTNTVPKGVQLSEVITPIPLKPDNLFIAMNDGGNMTITGDIRIRIDDNLPTDSRQVFIHFKPRSPSTPAIPPVEATRLSENTTAWHPYAPSFEWWNFTTTVPASQGFESFTVEVVDDGQSTVHANGGGGFPLQTDLIPQNHLSCSSVYLGRAYLLNLTVAVRDELNFQDVKLTVPIPVRQAESVVPRFESHVLDMEKTGVLADTGYSLYTASLDVRPEHMYVTIMSYGLSGRGGARDVEVPFVLWKGMGTCPYS